MAAGYVAATAIAVQRKRIIKLNWVVIIELTVHGSERKDGMSH